MAIISNYVDQVQQAYIAYYGRPADLAGLDHWTNALDAVDGNLDAIINDFGTSAEAVALFGGLDNEATVNTLFNQLFGRDADAEGLAFYVAGLVDGTMTAQSIALDVLNGASGSDATIVANKLSVAKAFTDALDTAEEQAAYAGDAAAASARTSLGTVDADTDVAAFDVAEAFAALSTAVVVDGNTISLTSGTDRGADFVGTADNDQFNAFLQQNAFAGGVSNSLSSADVLDGGAGTDTLNAEIVPEFFGATGDNQVDVQPRTSNIEVALFEARDAGSNDVGNEFAVTVDAKNMTEVKTIGSSFSDGDLVIENLTTLNNGNIDLTSTMTVVMDHTDNFNTDEDASDLTVYFDEDYLNTTTDSTGSTLLVRLVNAVTNVENENPLFGTDSISFSVGGELVNVDISAIAANAALDFSTAYAALADLINTTLTDAGYTTITATLDAIRPAVFSIDLDIAVGGKSYVAGEAAGSYYPILITNTGPEELTEGGFVQAQTETDTDINSSQKSGAASDIEVPISINIDLEKVGRDGEGGNLIIGGKNSDASGDTDVDQNDGIEIFDIDVLGDVDKPSNLGQILSTNGALKTVNIETAAEFVSGETHAALTVRGEDSDGNSATPFGGTLDTLNANGLLGDLYIGGTGDSRAVDIETFTATGGGDVTYWATYGDELGLASSGNLAYSAVTAGGSDTINAVVDGGAQVTVTTGSNNDTVVANVEGETDSASTQSKITINSVSGNNTVILSSTDAEVNEADVTTGTGTDTVTGGATHLTVDTNGANDVIYAENTGNKVVATLANAGSLFDTTVSLPGHANALTYSQLLNGRTLSVTVAMPENTPETAQRFVDGFEVTTTVNASTGVLTTERDLYEAAADAINADPVLNKLVSALVDSNGDLHVTYLVDGEVAGPDALVELDIVDADFADRTTTDQNALLAAIQDELNDSDILLADVATIYNLADTGLDYAESTGPGSDSTTDGENVVNGGLGDDVIVLSSNNATVDTLVMDAGGFGNDTIVHFETGAGQDVFDFSAFLNQVESTSGSTVSQDRVDGTSAAIATLIENSVAVTTFGVIGDNDAAAATALDFDTMTDSQVLAEMNAGIEFNASISDGNLVGTDVKSIVMIEDTNNADAADDNEGFYKVYETVADDATGDFTSVTLVGTLDFGSTLGALDDSNIA